MVWASKMKAALEQQSADNSKQMLLPQQLAVHAVLVCAADADQ
jgi:hypothetical protein